MIIDDYEPSIPDDWWEKRLGGSIEERTIARLRAKNENLRKAAEFEHNQLEDIKRAVDMMLEEHNAMLAENAKLCELVKNALTYIEYEGCGVECPETGHGATLTSCDICNRYETESCAYVIAQSAHELGIKEE